MKKFFSIAICLASVCSLSAQKAVVEQASKLSGKNDQLTEARGLIKSAMENPETQNDARTYFVAGKIELDAYDNGLKAKMINPDDPAANPVTMADELMAAYNYFLQALPYDSVPNEKGQVKPKHSKDIVKMINSHTNDFFDAGANYYNEKLYYPQAYEAFMVFSELPQANFFGKDAPKIDPAQVATAYFNAGISAYTGNDVEKSADAFKKARLAGYEDPTAYIYEIACWQALSQRDESRTKEAQDNITNVAREGYAKFGLEQPVFINNLINSYVIEQDFNGALAELNPIIDANPDNSALYGLRGFVYDRAGDDAASEADYRKAASMDDADFETLKNASKKIYVLGTQKLNDIQGNSPEDNAARQAIKTEYFEPAMQIVEKAGSMNPNDPDLQNIYENIEYSITTYFNN